MTSTDDQLSALLQQRLSRHTGLSLSDYAVLVHLSESGTDRMRAYELGAALRWEKSRLSHHLRRMESRGLIERRTCTRDGRGLDVVLTPEGRKAIEEAAPFHVEDVRSLLIDQLTPNSSGPSPRSARRCSPPCPRTRNLLRRARPRLSRGDTLC